MVANGEHTFREPGGLQGGLQADRKEARVKVGPGPMDVLGKQDKTSAPLDTLVS